MKKKHFNIILILFVIGFALESCCSGGDIGYNFTDKNDYTFNIYGNDIGHLYNIQNTWAHIDSFKILNELGDEVRLTRFTQNSYYYFMVESFYDKATDPNPLSSPVCKRYFFYYSYQDTDTLDICFTAKDSRCLNELNTFTAAYNNVEIQDIDIFNSGASFDIYKE